MQGWNGSIVVGWGWDGMKNSRMGWNETYTIPSQSHSLVMEPDHSKLNSECTTAKLRSWARSGLGYLTGALWIFKKGYSALRAPTQKFLAYKLWAYPSFRRLLLIFEQLRWRLFI